MNYSRLSDNRGIDNIANNATNDVESSVRIGNTGVRRNYIKACDITISNFMANICIKPVRTPGHAQY